VRREEAERQAGLRRALDTPDAGAQPSGNRCSPSWASGCSWSSSRPGHPVAVAEPGPARSQSFAALALFDPPDPYVIAGSEAIRSEELGPFRLDRWRQALSTGFVSAIVEVSRDPSREDDPLWMPPRSPTNGGSRAGPSDPPRKSISWTCASATEF
jgi:hypothetical protein